MNRPLFLALATLLTGCGSASNVNRLFGGEDHAGDSMLVEAQLAYDQGNFDHAADLATQLVQRDGDNEQAAVLLGYIRLSQGGVDPYILARKLVCLSQSGQLGGTSTATATATSVDCTTAGAAGSTTTASLAGGTTPALGANDSSTTMLRALGTLVDVSPSDIQTLLSAHTFGTADNGGQALQLFVNAQQSANGKDYTLEVPAGVTDQLRSSVATLNYMNQAMTAICRFVDPDVKIAEGSRKLSNDDCPTTSNARSVTDQAHFLWAFSHLAEALVYQTVLLYQPTGNTLPSIEGVLNVMNAPTSVTPDSFTAFAAKVLEAKNGVDAVLSDTGTSTADAGTPDPSMLRATLEDFNMVSSALGKLAGIPASVTAQVNAAFAQLNNVQKSLSGNVSSSAAAMKAQMTSKLTSGLSGQIDAAANKLATQYGAKDYAALKAGAATNPKVQASTDTYNKYTTQISTMCTSYASLSAGATNPTTPSACK